MILKRSDERTDDIVTLEGLAARCDSALKRNVEAEIAKLRSGVNGERGVAHVMNRVFGEGEQMALLHDLRIGVRGEYAQIDHLMIHRLQWPVLLQRSWRLDGLARQAVDFHSFSDCAGKATGNRSEALARREWLWRAYNPAAGPDSANFEHRSPRPFR